MRENEPDRQYLINKQSFIYDNEECLIVLFHDVTEF